MEKEGGELDKVVQAYFYEGGGESDSSLVSHKNHAFFLFEGGGVVLFCFDFNECT